MKALVVDENQEWHEVRALAVMDIDDPELVFHRSIGDMVGGWTVTHRMTGMAVVSGLTFMAARELTTILEHEFHAQWARLRMPDLLDPSKWRQEGQRQFGKIFSAYEKRLIYELRSLALDSFRESGA